VAGRVEPALDGLLQRLLAAGEVLADRAAIAGLVDARAQLHADIVGELVLFDHQPHLRARRRLQRRVVAERPMPAIGGARRVDGGQHGALGELLRRGRAPGHDAARGAGAEGEAGAGDEEGPA
jgi:hypothetical protein